MTQSNFFGMNSTSIHAGIWENGSDKEYNYGLMRSKDDTSQVAETVYLDMCALFERLDVLNNVTDIYWATDNCPGQYVIES